MRAITLEELLEAGCHFGHQVTRQNPKARDFIFEERDNIHIIDLEKTKEGLDEAAAYVKELAKNGGTLLILGTKRQAQAILEEEIKKIKDENISNIFWVIKRWIGGTFTNYSEVSKNFNKLRILQKRLKDENEKEKFTKREIGEWDKERQKLEGFYGGIASMIKVPDAIFVIDTHIEDLAIREAIAMNVKTVGITDTNSDPTVIDYPIPANDDAVGSLKLIIQYILEAWKEGKKQQQEGIKKQKLVEEKKAKEPEVKVEEKKVVPASSKEEPKKVSLVKETEVKQVKKPSDATTVAKAMVVKKAMAGKEKKVSKKKEAK
ncbi:30S ribosomal protein S2 [Patescibacteria group bacterium]|nr:30S ribosomal protein S2 [Patescibacteria group bacterium]